LFNYAYAYNIAPKIINWALLRRHKSSPRTFGCAAQERDRIFAPLAKN